MIQSWQQNEVCVCVRFVRMHCKSNLFFSFLSKSLSHHSNDILKFKMINKLQIGNSQNFTEFFFQTKKNFECVYFMCINQFTKKKK